jgi:uncharacterized NAD(P)/FAD-binding protein YdhS
MSKRNIIQLSTRDLEAKKAKEYEKFLIYELPTLEVNANIEHTFYDGKNKSISELREIERKAFDQLAYVHSKLPPAEAERFIQKCVPWYRVIKRLHAAIRELAIEDLRSQGIEVPTKKQGAN